MNSKQSGRENIKSPESQEKENLLNQRQVIKPKAQGQKAVPLHQKDTTAVMAASLELNAERQRRRKQRTRRKPRERQCRKNKGIGP